MKNDYASGSIVTGFFIFEALEVASARLSKQASAGRSVQIAARSPYAPTQDGAKALRDIA